MEVVSRQWPFQKPGAFRPLPAHACETGPRLLPVASPCPAFFLLVTFSPEEALQSFSVVKPLPLAPSPGILVFWADASGLSLLHSLLSLGLGLSLHPQPTCEPVWPSHYLFCC